MNDNLETLVIVLGETRSWEKTFDTFKKNLLEPLSADLCICIGAKPDYDTNNSYYQEAKYRFLYNEPDDWGVAFQEAADELLNIKDNNDNINLDEWLIHENTNSVFGKLSNYDESTSDIEFLGYYNDITDVPEEIREKFKQIVHHSVNFRDEKWRNCTYGINNTWKGVKQENVYTIRKNKYFHTKNTRWREYLKIRGEQWLGGILDEHFQHPGSAGILIFLRWFLWKNIQPILHLYDTFIITRSDYYYRMPHISIQELYKQGAGKDGIYVFDSEFYGGISDRHTVIPRQYMKTYCNILGELVLKQNEYYRLLNNHTEWNLEKIILFFMNKFNVKVYKFPVVMYSIRLIGGSTRWSMGIEIDETTGAYIKYEGEYNNSKKYFNKWQESQLNIHDFYSSFNCVSRL